MEILERDSSRLSRIERYFVGEHDMPYMPDSAELEYRLLAKRAITNWCPILVNTPAQSLYVDNFRKGDATPLEAVDDSPEWLSWQNSRLDGRQAAIYVEALKFGHSFVVTEKVGDKVISRGLAARRTVALYEDPATDLDPVAAVYVKKYAKDKDPGVLIVWDETHRIELTYTKGQQPVVKKREKHGANQCPVTRFTANVDLEGRTWGLIEPMIAVQDRINQTVFDLLISQTYNSFEVRTVTGMAPPMKTFYNEDTGMVEPLLNSETGLPEPDRIYLNSSRFMYAEDKDAKFSSLPGGSLDGFIAAAELAIRHLAALSQTPPHFLLGQIANISAEALEAAETALSRKVEWLRTGFGESWERVFRITSTLLGEDVEEDYTGEVIWRDLGASSMAQSADALGKLGDSLEIPKQGLWPMVPKVTRATLAEWKRLADEGNVDKRIVEAAAGMRQGPVRQPATPSSFGSEAMNDQSSTTG